MSDTAQGPGWWLGTDGRWYPPELHPDPGYAAAANAAHTADHGPERPRRARIRNAVVIGATMTIASLAGGVGCGALLEYAADESDSAIGDRTRLACRLERDAIIAAVEAGREASGRILDVEGLRFIGLLVDSPAHHTVVLDGPADAPTGFSVRPTGRCRDAG